jgi:hypothetical protein
MCKFVEKKADRIAENMCVVDGSVVEEVDQRI